MATPKFRKTTTPAGIAQYPWLTTPDTRFNDEGVYSTGLIVNEIEAKPLVDAINEEWEKFQATLKGPKAKKAPGSLGYDKEYTEDGDETGNVIFKIKTKATFKKDNQIIKRSVPFFDAKGKAFEPEALWGGSTIKCNITIAPYDAGGNLGVSLKLNAVQVIELQAGGSDASSFGFGEENGFSAPKKPTFESPSNTDDDDMVDDDDDF